MWRQQGTCCLYSLVFEYSILPFLVFISRWIQPSTRFFYSSIDEYDYLTSSCYDSVLWVCHTHLWMDK